MASRRRKSAAAFPEWATMQPELLGCIAERLSPLDYVRFGAVCKCWASVASVEKGLYLPLSSNRQIPLFLIPEQDAFLSIPEKQWHWIARIPEMEGKWCIGSQFGWLTLIDPTSKCCRPSLLNPLTRAHIHLPSQVLERGGRRFYPLHDYIYHAFRKIVLSSTPDAASGYTAVAIIGRSDLGFLKGGQKGWTLLNFIPDSSVEDVIYRDGKFIAITNDYRVKVNVIDLTGHSPVITEVTFNLQTHLTRDLIQDADNYLVDSYGDLLHVSIHYVGKFTAHRLTVKVSKFDAELAEWIPLESLGDRSIFVGLSHSISVSTLEDSRLRPNCIYFTGHVREWLGFVKSLRLISQVLRVVKLEDGRVESYYLSHRWMKCPPPVWFTPSLL